MQSACSNRNKLIRLNWLASSRAHEFSALTGITNGNTPSVRTQRWQCSRNTDSILRLLCGPNSVSYGGFRYRSEQLSNCTLHSNALPWTVAIPLCAAVEAGGGEGAECESGHEIPGITATRTSVSASHSWYFEKTTHARAPITVRSRSRADSRIRAGTTCVM